MSRKLVSDSVFKRKQQAFQITTEPNSGGDCKRLDPTFVFQRFIRLAKTINLKESNPNKPEFAKTIAPAWNLEECSAPLSNGIPYIVNGGAFLYRIPWPKTKWSGKIPDHHATYVTQKYSSATNMIDGYDGESTIKDMAQSKRSSIMGRNIFFEEDMQLKVKAIKQETILCSRSWFDNLVSCEDLSVSW